MARASFLNQVLPAKDSRGIQSDSKSISFSSPALRTVRENILYSSPSTFKQETPVKRVQGDEYDDYDHTYIESDVSKYGREKLGEIAGPYLTPYVYNRRFLDKQYGIWRWRIILKSVTPS
jgi:hypothetical protein